MKRKSKSEPQRGRPSTGKPYLVRLEPHHVERALKLGEGNIAAGVRKALEGKS